MTPLDRSSALALFENAPDAILGLSADGRIEVANQASARLLGRDISSLANARFSALFPREERSMIDSLLLGSTAPDGGRCDVRFAGPKRERVLSLAVSVPGAAGGDFRVVTLRDVSDERSAHEALARSEARYRLLFEGASDAIMTFDSLGRFTTVNDAGEVISGYTREELLGRFFGPLLPLDALPRAVYEFRRALSGSPGQFETVLTTKKGERRYISVTYCCPRRSEEVLCLIRDATDEKQMQQQLIQSEKMSAIGQLVSGVAHELNNPLASISAFAQLLLITELDAEQRHSADVIASEAKRAARIVNNLLTFARQHKAEKVFADVNRVLEDTLELRAYELNVRGIKLDREFSEQPLRTMLDVYQLQQVVLNLVTNAEHAMAEVKAKNHRLAVRSRLVAGHARIEVEDTGPGIPPEALERIFNPFFTTKPTGSGTGLGLSISLGIVSEHGGRIWAENATRGGARFVIELPMVDGTPPPPAAATTDSSPLPGLRILVADDEEPIRVALERYLSRAGHRVSVASTGTEALDHANASEFDVILLDMRMPDLSGQQIFELWASDKPDFAGRVIFLTGDTVSADLQAFLVGSGRPYVAKPFLFEDVLAALPQRTNGKHSQPT